MTSVPHQRRLTFPFRSFPFTVGDSSTHWVSGLTVGHGVSVPSSSHRRDGGGVVGVDRGGESVSDEKPV